MSCISGNCILFASHSLLITIKINTIKCLWCVQHRLFSGHCLSTKLFIGFIYINRYWQPQKRGFTHYFNCTINVLLTFNNNKQDGYVFQISYLKKKTWRLRLFLKAHVLFHIESSLKSKTKTQYYIKPVDHNNVVYGIVTICLISLLCSLIRNVKSFILQ